MNLLPASVQHALLKVHANAIGAQEIEINKDIPGGISILKDLASKNLPAGHHFFRTLLFQGALAWIRIIKWHWFTFKLLQIEGILHPN